jgi:hypothetical protein
MKYLVQTVETYRVESESQAAALIEEAKQDRNFVLTKYNCEHKEKKQKGEVIDSWYRVTLTKFFTDEKDPALNHKITYEVDA